MKKLAIAALCLTTASAFAWEANVKTGFDFYRGTQNVDNKKHTKDEMGWTLGAEFIPFNKGIVEFGAGFEHNFGVKKATYKASTATENGTITRAYTPVYALAKVNLLRSKDNTSSLYTLARLGYVFKTEHDTAKGSNGSATSPKAQNGVYYGLGLGAEKGPFMIEGIYDGSYMPAPAAGQNGMLTHKAGVRVGFRFGDYKFVEPVVEEVPVMVVEEPKVEVPVIVEVPKVEAPKVVESKGKLIHASCDEDAKKCIIHGFKIDGREPNAEEKENIREIAQLLNDFAKSGSTSIVGHTDATGSVAYNQKLSVARAANVNKLLREYGLKEEIKVTSVSGKSKLEPMATNKTKEGRYLNRRVEIIFDELVR